MLKKFSISLRIRLLISIAVASLVIAPQIVAFLITPSMYVFNGINTISNFNDVEGVYFSVIKQSSEGGFKYINQFDFGSTPFFLYPVYLVLGKIAALGNLSIPFVYHLSSLILSFTFSMFLFKFLSLFFTKVKEVFLAFLLINFGGVLLMIVPEANVFVSYTFPHFIVAQMSLFISIYFLIRYASYQNPLNLFVIFFATFILSMVHPWMSLLLGVSYFIWATYLFQRNGNPRYYLPMIAILAASVPWLYFYSSNVFWTTFPLKSKIVLLPLIFGPFLFLAILGLFNIKFKKKIDSFIFLRIWLLTQVVFMYLPFAFQRRFSEGISVPIAIFAVLGIKKLINFHAPSKPLIVITLPFLFTFIFVYPLINIFWLIDNKDVYKTPGEINAAKYLDQNGGFDKRILSSPYNGNFIAGRAKISVYLGHGTQTPNFDQKLIITASFYKGETSKKEREEFLKKESICYIYVGPQETQVLKINLDKETYIQKVFHENEISLYKLKIC
ncbi:MAG: hypothetical protein HYW63_02070 [Candidatus Levybacteria bacterium]|nr:hypothetical protein [Candidatus Levybacteria bacterium]